VKGSVGDSVDNRGEAGTWACKREWRPSLPAVEAGGVRDEVIVLLGNRQIKSWRQSSKLKNSYSAVVPGSSIACGHDGV
jgi:hypothetical protein